MAFTSKDSSVIYSVPSSSLFAGVTRDALVNTQIRKVKMKIVPMFFAALFVSLSAQAAEVVDAKLDSTQENIIVTVRHGGGCGKHSYDLKLLGCAESMPVQCQAKLIHKSEDYCEAILIREATFNLKKYGLQDKYYANGSLTINGFESKATVVLPSGASKPKPKAKGIQCTTHTGSDLVISDKQVILVTKDKEVATYTIVKKDFRSIETYPSIDQTVYALNDGRSIKTEFRSGLKEGKGMFIRTDGTYSPEFSCSR